MSTRSKAGKKLTEALNFFLGAKEAPVAYYEADERTKRIMAFAMWVHEKLAPGRVDPTCRTCQGTGKYTWWHPHNGDEVTSTCNCVSEDRKERRRELLSGIEEQVAILLGETET